MGTGSPALRTAYARRISHTRTRSRRSRSLSSFQKAMDAGQLRMQRKDYSRAILFFRRAVRLNPRSSDARRHWHLAEFEQQYQAGLHFVQQERLRYAEVSLRRALRIARIHSMRAQARLANLQLALVAGERSMHSQSYESAAKSYEKALAFSPNNRTALAGLTEARFRDAFQEGLAALSAGELGPARARFRECLIYEPRSASALEEMNRVNRIEKDTVRFQSAFLAANVSLDREAWSQAGIEIKKLVGIMQEVEQLGFHSTVIFHSRGLLPAYVSYADGDLEGAYRLAQNVQGNTDSVRAAKFRRFLQRSRRFGYLYALAPALLGGYIAILLGSIFAGLRRVLAVPRPLAGRSTSYPGRSA